jgi:hypothetical protein
MIGTNQSPPVVILPAVILCRRGSLVNSSDWDGTPSIPCV